MKSVSEESTEKLIESLHAPHKKPEMARSKKPEFAPKPDFPEEKPEEEIQKTKKDQAIEFVTIAFSIGFPFISSVAIELDAIALPHPKVSNLTSLMMSLSIFK